MLLVFHVRLALLVNMGPRVHFVAVLHDSSAQSGSVEICGVFLRRETKHLRPLSGEYLSGWHSSLVPNDIGITMLQNIYINKLPCPINSPPGCCARHRLLPEHRVRSPSASIVHVFAQTCNTQSWQTVCLFTIRLGAALYDNKWTSVQKAGIFRKQRNSLTHGRTQSRPKGRDHLLQYRAVARYLHRKLKSLKKEKEKKKVNQCNSCLRWFKVVAWKKSLH